MLRVRDKNNDDSTYGFETPSRQACKHLWKCCVEHHAFFRLVQVNPGFGSSGGVFSLGSRFRYSGHTEKQVLQQVQSVQRQPPQFTRRPSKRYSRRSESESGFPTSSNIDNDHVDSGGDRHHAANPAISPYMNGSLKRQSNSGGASGSGSAGPTTTGRSRSATRSLPRHVSLMAATSRRLQQSQPSYQQVPNGGNEGESSMQDLSLQSLQWLESRGLYGSSLRRGSLPEQILAHNYPRRAKSTNGQQSDAESDASGVSFASHGGRHHHHHRSRNESGSEFDPSGSSNSMRRQHRSRRKRQGSYKLVESDDQWQKVQQQRQSRSSGRASSASHHHQSGLDPNSSYNHNNSIRKSGYMNSGGETETELASHASLKRNHQRRRQRSRSRSPGRESGRGRLPPEILQKLEFGLVEPSAENMQGDIPFTNVETTGTGKPSSSRYHNGQAYARPRGHHQQLRTATTRSVVSAVEASASSPAQRHRQHQYAYQPPNSVNNNHDLMGDRTGSSSTVMAYRNSPSRSQYNHSPQMNHQQAGYHHQAGPSTSTYYTPPSIPPPPPKSTAQDLGARLQQQQGFPPNTYQGYHNSSSSNNPILNNSTSHYTTSTPMSSAASNNQVSTSYSSQYQGQQQQQFHHQPPPKYQHPGQGLSQNRPSPISPNHFQSVGLPVATTQYQSPYLQSALDATISTTF